jgi:acetolactate synthase-1/2/3 large subunit
VTKGTWKVSEHRRIVPTLFEAYRTAVSGFPGPVYVEVPVNLQLFEDDAGELPRFEPPADPPPPDAALIDRAADLLAAARRPGIFVGWGAVDASAAVAEIAERLGAPVATTLQGLSAFPGDHPLHTGMGFSRAAVPAAENAFRDIDALLAIGTRFGEIPTGSYGCVVPENLVHVDIDPAAIDRNYEAKVAIVADARAAATMLLERLCARGVDDRERREAVAAAVASDKKAYREEWAKHLNDRVNPSLFFEELRRQLADDALLVVDDGNHTYLVAELFEVRHPRGFVSPTDFNCMGYAVPGAIGAKLANPDRQVAAIVGDGAFLMTGLETLTATALETGIAYFVFHDGELSQIAQGQEIPYNRKTCTVLGDLRLDGIATATGAHFVSIDSNENVTDGIREALAGAALGKPVVVDVRVDYSKRTRFTQGVVGTVLKRFPLRDKVRFVGRALYRKVTG